jgi:hypothetical protein
MVVPAPTSGGHSAGGRWLSPANDRGLLHAAVVHEPIDLGALIARAQADGVGAISVFVGTVRDHNDGRP